jgi:hypothetical protein
MQRIPVDSIRMKELCRLAFREEKPFSIRNIWSQPCPVTVVCEGVGLRAGYGRADYRAELRIPFSARPQIAHIKQQAVSAVRVCICESNEKKY